MTSAELLWLSVATFCVAFVVHLLEVLLRGRWREGVHIPPFARSREWFFGAFLGNTFERLTDWSDRCRPSLSCSKCDAQWFLRNGEGPDGETCPDCAPQPCCVCGAVRRWVAGAWRNDRMVYLCAACELGGHDLPPPEVQP